MIVLIVRHAHRNKPMGGKLDNGLSEKGRKQTKRLSRTLANRLCGVKDLQFYSSPKKRCQETLRPLAKKMKSEVETLSSLDVPDEASIRDRVKKTVRFLSSLKTETVILGVHGEWTEAFFHALFGQEFSLDKGGWAELERQADGTYILQSLVPERLNR